MEVTHAREKERCYSKHSRMDLGNVLFFCVSVKKKQEAAAVLRLKLGRRVPMTVQDTRAFLLGFPNPASLTNI